MKSRGCPTFPLVPLAFEGLSFTQVYTLFGETVLYIVTCQAHPALVKRVQCTVRSSF